MGPWTFTTFMDLLDDERYVNDALLFGVRGSFRPPRTGLEIGISRAAQWCGDGRPCDLSTFFDLLVGNDNKGVTSILRMSQAISSVDSIFAGRCRRKSPWHFTCSGLAKMVAVAARVLEHGFGKWVPSIGGLLVP